MFKSNSTQKKSGNEIEQLTSQADNQKCFDCEKTPASWASINNGIFICFDCCGEHRNFDPLVSIVKSVTLDQWTDIHIKYMRLGGNLRLRAFLETYGLPTNQDKKAVYSSKLMTYYRRKLKAEVNSETFYDPLPAKEDYWTPAVSGYQANAHFPHIEPNANTDAFSAMPSAYSTENQDQGDSSQNPNECNQAFVASFLPVGVSSFIGSMWGNTVEVASNIKSKINETEVGSKLIIAGEKTIEAISYTGGVVYEKGSEVFSNSGKTFETISQTGGKILEKGSEIGSKTIESISYAGGVVYEKGQEVFSNSGKTLESISQTGGMILEKGSEIGGKTIEAVSFAGGKVIEKGSEIIQSDTMKIIANQAENSVNFLKEKIVNGVQSVSQSTNPRSNYDQL